MKNAALLFLFVILLPGIIYSRDHTLGNFTGMDRAFENQTKETHIIATLPFTRNNYGIENSSVVGSVHLNNPKADFRSVIAIDRPLVRIRAGYADESPLTDPVVVYLDPASNRSFNKVLDALKLMNTDVLVPNIYAISSDSIRLSIYAWPAFSDTADMIPLGLYLNHGGYITFNAADMDHIPAGKHIYLYDVITGAQQDLQVNPNYHVQLEVGWYEQRFFLVFRNLVTAVSTISAGSASYKIFNKGPNLSVQLNNVPGARCIVVVSNRLGQMLFRKQLNGNGLHNLGSGFINGLYIVIFYTQHHLISKKIFIGS